MSKKVGGWEYEYILELYNGFIEILNKKIIVIVKDEFDNFWLSLVYVGVLYFGVKSVDIFVI